MITEDYVSFETAKLLKEKGFDVPTKEFYSEAGKTLSGACSYNWNDDEGDCSRPSLWLAMKWLREVHNLFILVEFSTFEFSKERPFMWSIRYQKVDGDYIGGTYHPTYEKACESAIKYCLEELI